MYIIDIIPLAFIPRNQAQILSYFHKEPLNRGAVVEVLIGRRKIKGVVAGYPLVDVKVTVYDGSYHDVDSFI